MDTPTQSPAVEYPKFTVGGKTYLLCWGAAARYALQQWGYWIGTGTMKPVPVMAWAAAAAGTVKDGIWKSARLDSPFDLLDNMTKAEEDEVSLAVVDMLKNMLPGATLSLVESPAQSQEGTAAA